MGTLSVMTSDQPAEVTALAINVTIPEALRWTDTRRGVMFTLTTLNVRLLADGRLAARAYGRPADGGRGAYVSFAVPDDPVLAALIAEAATRAGSPVDRPPRAPVIATPRPHRRSDLRIFPARPAAALQRKVSAAADQRACYGEGWGWNILADPDGNEFCILQPPAGYWGSQLPDKRTSYSYAPNAAEAAMSTPGESVYSMHRQRQA
jgi:hypothetical protein